MDQVKIGVFLKDLRREKNLTQEQLAEHFNVSGRTVSRWETGSNLPDISTLVEISEFYEVTIPEIIAGERKSEDMDKEVKETALSLADYAEAINKRLRSRVLLMTLLGLVGLISFIAIETSGLDVTGDNWDFAAGFCIGLVFSVMFLQIAYLSGWLGRMKARKQMKKA